jgi:hypothetical protein
LPELSVSATAISAAMRAASVSANSGSNAAGFVTPRVY